MQLLSKGVWFVVVVLAAACVKLLFDNIFYAAFMARLKSSFGIEEGDVTGIVAANLIPIIATMAVVTFIYWLSLQYHKQQAAAQSGAVSPQPPPPSPTSQSMSRLRRFFLRRDPLPIIAVALAVAFCGGIAWQYKYGPLTQLGHVEPPKPPSLSSEEKRLRVAGIDEILNDLYFIKEGTAKSRDLLDNWQYQLTQTNGANDFMTQVAAVYTDLNGIGMIGLSNAGKKYANYPDIRDLAKLDLPDCSGKTLAFYNELKRIKEHTGADMVFTLINDTKLAEWRASIPECDKWATARIGAAQAKRAEYTGP